MALWRSSSFYSNILTIFTTNQSAKEGQIGPIHCIRFVSTCWVIMGHRVVVFATWGSRSFFEQLRGVCEKAGQ